MKDRKKDHIHLALDSQIPQDLKDRRFDYEPLYSPHPDEYPPVEFLGKKLRMPIWVSSMTGGTVQAGTINHNLAQACREFGTGMGLGSCRIIMEDDSYFKDFDVRSIIGDDLPLYANLGVAQIEKTLASGEIDRVRILLDKLQADGLIVHVNPLQEWMQPEGDRYRVPPLDTIGELIQKADFPVIVKEVGQGMGPESLKTLMKLLLEAIELAAFGGTNFIRMELRRDNTGEKNLLAPLSFVGHDAEEMTRMVNHIVDTETDIQCRQLIISGGIQTFLDGYYLINLSKIPAIYGQASSLLKYACRDYESLHVYLSRQLEGLKLAQAYLRIKEN